MQLSVFAWNCCPPCPPVPDAGAGDYEELPVSLPPHVPRGLSREDAPGLDGWEEGAYAEAAEQLSSTPDHHGGAEIIAGGAAGLWLRAAFASVCRMVTMSATLCGHL